MRPTDYKTRGEMVAPQPPDGTETLGIIAQPHPPATPSSKPTTTWTGVDGPPAPTAKLRGRIAAPRPPVKPE